MRGGKPEKLDEVDVPSAQRSGMPSAGCGLADLPLLSGHQALHATVGTGSDGEGSYDTTHFYEFDGERLTALFDMEDVPSGGSGYPHERKKSTLTICSSKSQGVNDLEVTIEQRLRDCCDDTGGITESSSTERTLPEPRWLASVRSATASSVLKEKAHPDDFYAADKARDGLPNTGWCEGAPGPGAGQWLELALVVPVALKAVKLVHGYGTNAATWQKNLRLRKVRPVFNDGKSEEAELADQQKPQRIEIKRTEAIFSVKIEILSTYKAGKHEDACIAEVEIENR